VWLLTRQTPKKLGKAVVLAKFVEESVSDPVDDWKGQIVGCPARIGSWSGGSHHLPLRAICPSCFARLTADRSRSPD
jgi:hypothetical protein